MEVQKMEYRRYVQSQNDRLTLGDLMKDQLKNLEAPKKKTKKTEKKKEGKNDKS
jgi:hypothetical protein